MNGLAIHILCVDIGPDVASACLWDGGGVRYVSFPAGEPCEAIREAVQALRPRGRFNVLLASWDAGSQLLSLQRIRSALSGATVRDIRVLRPNGGHVPFREVAQFAGSPGTAVAVGGMAIAHALRLPTAVTCEVGRTSLRMTRVELPDRWLRRMLVPAEVLLETGFTRELIGLPEFQVEEALVGVRVSSAIADLAARVGLRESDALIVGGPAARPHLNELAEGLAVSQIVLPAQHAFLMATGLLHADIVHDAARDVSLEPGALEAVRCTIGQLMDEVARAVQVDGYEQDDSVVYRFAEVRLTDGSPRTVPIESLSDPDRLLPRLRQGAAVVNPVEITRLCVRCVASPAKPSLSSAGLLPEPEVPALHGWSATVLAGGHTLYTRA